MSLRFCITQLHRCILPADEWEKIELPEVGTVEVPISLSPPLHSALLTLSQRLGDMSVAHLLSRNVRKRLSSEIAHQLSNVIKNTVNGANTVQRTWIQLLFDCRVLHYMFPDERYMFMLLTYFSICSFIVPTHYFSYSFKKYLTEIETHIDPFDLSLLASPLSTNVSLAVCRTQLLFSCLLVDIVPNKDVQVSQSYSELLLKLHILTFRLLISYPILTIRNVFLSYRDLIGWSVFSIIISVTEDPSKQNQVTKAPRNKLLSSTGMLIFIIFIYESRYFTVIFSGMKNTPSLSSFVDKISSSWFGGN
uniref:Conserved oligomeric Golgi complex subunit 1 n=1 Tax=Heterorhabditis bacteriophora TaxID=37862 RepID=A0A1I7WVL2_HETBA